MGQASRRERRAALSLASLLPVLAAVLLASPAAAQDGSAGKNEVVLRADGGYYVVYEDGSLNIGGDMLGSCDTVLEDIPPTDTPFQRKVVHRQIQEQVEVCEEAGFQVSGSESLPETGGPSLPAVAALGLILSYALCSFGVRR